ncbi:hypothetical protein Hanom_Chr06g00540581 [Helianthus anomalus]
MAITQDTIVAIRKRDAWESEKLLTIANVNDKYTVCTYPIDPDQVNKLLFYVAKNTDVVSSMKIPLFCDCCCCCCEVLRLRFCVVVWKHVSLNKLIAIFYLYLRKLTCFFVSENMSDFFPVCAGYNNAWDCRQCSNCHARQFFGYSNRAEDCSSLQFSTLLTMLSIDGKDVN